jgi:hypothetical protein
MNKLQKLHLLLSEVAKDLNMNVSITVAGNELDYDGFIYVRHTTKEHEGLVLDRLTVFYKVLACVDPCGEMVKLSTSDHYDAAREVMYQLLDTSLCLIDARLQCGEESEDDGEISFTQERFL